MVVVWSAGCSVVAPSDLGSGATQVMVFGLGPDSGPCSSFGSSTRSGGGNSVRLTLSFSLVDKYTQAKEAMLQRAGTPAAPWTVARSDIGSPTGKDVLRTGYDHDLQHSM